MMRENECKGGRKGERSSRKWVQVEESERPYSCKIVGNFLHYYPNNPYSPNKPTIRGKL